MNKLSILICLLACTFSFGSDLSRQQYLQLAQEYPRLVSLTGDAQKGAIAIILNAEQMEDIEKSTGRDVGVVYRDDGWIWVNDACQFPSGKQGVYGRLLWTGSLVSTPSVAVMPILPDGRIVLNCCFRHGTQSWEVDLPAGLVEPHERTEDAAHREVLKETGMLIDHPHFLGAVTTDTGITTSVVPIYVAQVIGQKEPQLDDSESKEEILALTIEEIQEAYKEGYYKVVVHSEEKEIFFRTPLIAYALSIFLQGDL